MADILDFTNIFEEDEDSIRARVEADADADIDKRPGELFYDITTPVILEIERLWDSFNYFAALTFLPWSNGVYLDYKGLYEIGLERGTATNSSGVVTFIGDLETAIPAGTITSNSPQIVTDPVVQFETIQDEEIGMLAPTTAVTAVAGGAGAITSGTGLALEPISYKVTFVGRGGETDPGPESTPDLSVSSKEIELTDIPTGPSGTTARKIYRRDDTAAEWYYLATISDNTTTVYTDNEAAHAATIGDIAPTANSTDRVDINCTSVDTGLVNNVGIEEIDQLVDAIDGVESVLNSDVFTGGTDDESDIDYQTRLVQAISSDSGQGNQADYITWSTEVDGVEAAAVIPLWNGDNTVKVILVGPGNSAVASSVVDEVQELLDPDEDGSGQGYAPIGAIVTAASVTEVSLSISATIVHESTEYTLDGTNNTSATRTPIVDAVQVYLSNLDPGGDVIWAEVLAVMVQVEGVADVQSLLINSAASNIAIANTEVAALTSHTLTE